MKKIVVILFIIIILVVIYEAKNVIIDKELKPWECKALNGRLETEFTAISEGNDTSGRIVDIQCYANETEIGKVIGFRCFCVCCTPK